MTDSKIQNDVQRILAAKQFAREMFPEVTFPNVSRQPIWYGRKGRTQWTDKVGLIDLDEDRPFAIASKEYNLILHEEIIMQTWEAMEQAKDWFGEGTWSLTMPYEGARMVLKVKFNGVEMDIDRGDKVSPEITIRSSYDLGWKFSSIFGAFRWICSNGAFIGKMLGKYQKRHIPSLSMDIFTDMMQNGVEAFAGQALEWKRWSTITIEEGDYVELWNALPFSEAEKARAEALPEAGTQLLLPDALKRHELRLSDFHNVVTQFATHEIGSEVRREELGEEIARVFSNPRWSSR